MPEQHALLHEHAVEQQATTAMGHLRYEEEAMKRQLQEWGCSAHEEVNSLLNSFHASTLRGQESEALVADLQARLRHAESTADEAHGHRVELHQAAAQIKVAEHKAASDALLMQAHAQEEAMVARRLHAEMCNVQAATDRLRENLAQLENRVELGAIDREAVVAYRSALETEASQMKSEFAMQEQQLAGARQTLLLGQACNAAQSHELAALFQRCRALPAAVPAPQYAESSTRSQALPTPPPSSTADGGVRMGADTAYQAAAMPANDVTAASMTVEEHENG